MLSAKVSKYNRYSGIMGAQERHFVVTNMCIYNFNKKKLRRVIAIMNLLGITKNLNAKSKEFVIHVENEPDYRLSCDVRDNFLSVVKIAYITHKRNNLKIFGIGRSKTLVDFVTTEKDV